MEDITFNLTENLLKQHALTRPNRIALQLVDDIGVQQEISYQMLLEDVYRLASGLKSLELPEGAVICIQADYIYDLLLLFLAANLVKLVPAPLILSMSTDEVEYILNDSNAQAYFYLTQEIHSFQLPPRCRQISFDEYQTLTKFPFQEIKPDTQANDPAFIFYTSGSSGHPKGVIHAQRAVLGRKPSLENWLTLNGDDVVMQTDNLCWTYSMFTGFLDPLIVGATAVVITASNRSSLAEDNIPAQKWFQFIDYYHVTVLASTPDIYNTMVTSPSISAAVNPTLRQAGSAGAFLADTTQQRWLTHFHFPIFIALGMSELSTFISTGPNVAYRQDALGKIQPGRKATVLPIENGFDSVPANQPAMLAIHRDELGLMLGYVGQDKNYHYRGDWFLTQDIVHLDEEGYVHYHGRADMLIKVDGGFRVSPIEIENQLKLYDKVRDAACGAIFDAKKACDELVLYIVADENDEKTAKEMYQFLEKHLSDYKIPSHFYFVDHLPLNIRGKIIRDKLSTLQPLKQYSSVLFQK